MIDEGPSPSHRDSGTPTLVPDQRADSVAVAPPPAWITRRNPDESFHHPAGDSILLLDVQCHATTGECYRRVVRRLETTSAIEQQTAWSLDFDPAFQRVTVHSLTVVRDGARIEHAHPGLLQLLRREDGRIAVTLTFEYLCLNDIVDIAHTVHSTPRVLPDRAWFSESIPPQSTLHEYRFSVRFATDRSMRWNTGPEPLPPAMREANGETEWCWMKENVPPLAIEEGMPSWNIIHTWFQVSDCESWAEVGNGIAAAWREDFADPELLRVSTEIAQSVTPPLERAEAAITFVQDEIRGLSANVDFGCQTPASPGAVIRRGSGNSMDKAFLLAHLLRLLGVNAEPVLVNAVWRGGIERQTPTPNAFDHAIVHLEIDGSHCWVDPSLSLQGGNPFERHTPDYQLGLPVRPDSDELQTILRAAEPPDRCELQESFLLDTRPGRNSSLQVTVKTAGLDADELRRARAAGEHEFAESRLLFYKQHFPNITRSGELRCEDDRAQNIFSLSESYELPEGVLEVMRNPKLGIFRYHSHLIQAKLRVPETRPRRQPFVIPHPCNVEHSIEMQITAPVGRFMPSVSKDSTAFRYLRESKRGFNRAFVKYAFSTLAGVITAEQFEEHRGIVHEIWPGTAFFLQFSRAIPAPRTRFMAEAEVLPEKQPDPPPPAVAPAAPAVKNFRRVPFTKAVPAPEAAGAPASPPVRRAVSSEYDKSRNLVVPLIDSRSARHRLRAPSENSPKEVTGPKADLEDHKPTPHAKVLILVGAFIILVTIVWILFSIALNSN